MTTKFSMTKTRSRKVRTNLRRKHMNIKNKGRKGNQQEENMVKALGLTLPELLVEGRVPACDLCCCDLLGLQTGESLITQKGVAS